MSKAASKGFRIEHDSMGELQVPADACGAPRPSVPCRISGVGQRMPRGFIRALGLVKGAAAGVNAELGHLPKNVAKAIQTAAAEVGRQLGRALPDRRLPDRFGHVVEHECQ